MSGSNERRFLFNGVVFLIVLLGVVSLAVAMAQRVDVRIDLTEEGLHTVSPETREVLDGLEDRVTIQYWVSEMVPTGFDNIRRDTIDYLKEYARLAEGKIQLEIRDPKEWIDTEIRKAEEAGEEDSDPEPMNPFAQFDPSKLPLPDRKKYEFTERFEIPEVRGESLEKDRVEVRMFYSGIRMTYRDRSPETIALHQNLSGLEYELTSRFVKLTIEEKPKVVFFHGRPSDTMTIAAQGPVPGRPPTTVSPYQPLLEAEFVTALFDVETIELTEASRIPVDADLLVVAQPDGLTERQVYEIERYVRAGGPTLFFVSNFSGEFERFTITRLSSGLEPLFNRWGVRLGDRVLSSVDCGAVTQQVDMGIGMMRRPQPFPLIPVAGTKGIDPSSPLTLGLSRIDFPFATGLLADTAALDGSGLELTVLAKSSEETWESPYSRQVSRDMVRPTTETLRAVYDLAYFLEGEFPGTVEEGDSIPPWSPPTPDENGETPEAAAAELVPALEVKPGRVVIAGSCDMIKVSHLNENGSPIGLLMNCLQGLSLGEDLVNIRAKGQRERPLYEGTPVARNLAKWGNTLGVPFAVLLLGGLRYLARRRAAHAYEERFLREHGGGEA
ncbi:MAG: GldG family protein [Planctomycetota bacterium]